MKYVNVTVRVGKINKKVLEKGINEGYFEYISICEDKKRYGEGIFRYIGFDKPNEGLYYNDLVIAE